MPSPIFTKLANQQIIIFGLGGEGLSTYRFLRARLPASHFILIDEKPLTKLDPVWQELVANDDHTQFTTSITDLPQDDLRNSTLFKTPGIPFAHPIIQKVIMAGSQVSSNTQLFFELVTATQKAHNLPGIVTKPEPISQTGIVTEQKLISQPELVTIGVTGTKGKSTTASMIYHLLHENNLDAYLGGNIGQPALEMWLKWQHNPAKSTTQTIFVLELSCHQLAELKNSPHIAVVQNIVSEHLDYYADFAQYYQAKTQIARFQTPADMIIFNQDSATATKLAKLSLGKKLSFSLKKGNNDRLLELAQNSPLRGQHNLYNVMPAIMIAQHFHLKNTQVMAALRTFRSLPHRLEFVATVNGVEYYDDSIATVPEATIAALQAFPEKRVVLIAGGYERHQNYQQLATEILKHQVRALALLPTTGHRLLAEIERLNPDNSLRTSIKEFNLLAEAVNYTVHQTQPGDVVLLSPAAASFNNFKNYKDRGNQFKEAVQRLGK